MLTLSYLFYAVATLLPIRRLMCVEKKSQIFFLALALAAGAALSWYEQADLSIMLLGIMIFNGVASTYHTKENYAFFLLAIFFMFPIYMLAVLIAQSMLLGFLSCAYFFLKPAKRSSAAVERRRDLIQILMGLVVVFSFALFAEIYVKIALMFLILAFSLVGNFVIRNKKNKFSRMLNSLERRDAMFGQGAIWLAIGTLVALSFISGQLIIAVLAAVLVGDAVATIVGTTYKLPLPYNEKKSALGTIAYLVSTALLTFPFVGYAAVSVALVGAFVESLPVHVDDNFDTAVALTVLIKLLSYAKLI